MWLLWRNRRTIRRCNLRIIETLSLLKEVKFDMAFLFAYSMREKTHAHRNYQDDVPEEIKNKRLKKMIDTFIEQQASLNQR